MSTLSVRDNDGSGEGVWLEKKHDFINKNFKQKTAQCSGAVRMALPAEHAFLVSFQTHDHPLGFLVLPGKK